MGVARETLKQLVFKMKDMGFFLCRLPLPPSRGGFLLTLLLVATLLSSTSNAAPAPSLIEIITAKLAAKGLGVGLGVGSGIAASAFSRPSVAILAPAVPVTRTVVTRTTNFG